ncbi:MAG: hypothetical protein MI924_11030, partial [Chloroflexales bacterium]|nr:hypothetical protein [Chloroflexales bacterium]
TTRWKPPVVAPDCRSRAIGVSRGTVLLQPIARFKTDGANKKKEHDRDPQTTSPRNAATITAAVRLIGRKIPLTLADLPEKGAHWPVTPAIFARAGVTVAARETLAAHGGMAVDLAQVYADLG